MAASSKAELLRLLEEKALRTKYHYASTLFPDEGPLRRELYKKHLEFFAAGAQYNERAFIAANRIGKTQANLYEVALHLTGLYPDWWTGRRFSKPTFICCCGTTNVQTTSVIQEVLLGNKMDFGTGMVPQGCIGRHLSNPGSPDALVSCEIKHVSGGWSKVIFKSYEHKVESFQGYKFDVVALDEEPPSKHYQELFIRTMTTQGIVILSVTPVAGLTDVMNSFAPGGVLPKDGIVNPHKYVVAATWDDVPHLTEDDKERMLSGMMPNEVEARSQGIISIGAGTIYPVAESLIYVDPMKLPDSWPKAFGMDVGWNKTAVIWGAYDEASDTVYIYSEHYMGQAEPAIHADAIRARGAWIPGVVDPHARDRAQADGRKLMEMYLDQGLNLDYAVNSVQTGLQQVWQRMSSGRLKIFNSCLNLQREIRTYHYDKNGKVVKENDHACDALRYLIMSGIQRACTSPNFNKEDAYASRMRQIASESRSGADKSPITGY